MTLAISGAEKINLPAASVNPTSMYTEITDIIDSTTAYADAMKTKVDTALLNLETALGEYDPATSIVNVNIPGIDAPEYPPMPNFPALVLDDSFPADIGDPPVFEELGDIDFSFIAPVPPSKVDVSFDYTQHEYTSEMWQALFSKVHAAILEEGPGLSDATHLAMVQREQESRRLSQDREYRKTLDAVGSRGFELPSGQVAAMQINFSAEIMKRDQDALNTITIKDFEMAFDYKKFAITTGTQLEQLLREAFENREGRNVEIQKATTDYLLRAYEQNVKLYLAQWEGIKISLEALVSKIKGITEYNDGLVRIYLGQAEVYKSKIESITSKNRGLVDVRQSEITIYTAEIDAVSKQYQMLIEEAKMGLEASKLKVTQAIENEKINLQAYMNKESLAERIGEAVASVSAQSLASALGAVNTSISHGYQGSERKGETWSYGGSLSESHSYEEPVT
ncbi:hypothetical protein [Desulfotalea psychrophila]|uniref:Uncharacterized protein n=1 Tax=Desulfotalea psychrophila (strain LSv54 / DSM 12343) TaxID=177439 RepID=Q6ALQ1_DESPS|nr:hypothetical protein [Desulfotalea psychrophila]CAG36724.1 unknown protein [Desulfotalea psychrophila LSv54]